MPHIIGVTGHRDIHAEIYEPICHLISKWLDEHIHYYGSPLNLRIQSPLAAGADQLVAQLAVEKGIPLYVALPFSVERYEKDFTSDELKVFHELLQQAVRVRVLSNSKEEALAYYAAGSFIAQTSDTLLAIWDGLKEPELVGGTAHIIRCQLFGFPEEDIHREVINQRETIWIKTIRSSTTQWEKPVLKYLNMFMYMHL